MWEQEKKNSVLWRKKNRQSLQSESERYTFFSSGFCFYLCQIFFSFIVFCWLFEKLLRRSHICIFMWIEFFFELLLLFKTSDCTVVCKKKVYNNKIYSCVLRKFKQLLHFFFCHTCSVTIVWLHECIRVAIHRNKNLKKTEYMIVISLFASTFSIYSWIIKHKSKDRIAKKNQFRVNRIANNYAEHSEISKSISCISDLFCCFFLNFCLTRETVTKPNLCLFLFGYLFVLFASFYLFIFVSRLFWFLICSLCDFAMEWQK